MSERTPPREGASSPIPLLLVEDDEAFAMRMARNLGLEGFEVDIAADPAHALRRLPSRVYRAMLCDIRMPGMSGLELLERIRAGGVDGAPPDLPIVMLTSLNTVETAVDAMRLGANDYLTKDASRSEVAVRLRRAIDQHTLSSENARLRETIQAVGEFRELVGTSAPLQRIKDDIAEVAETNATVMLLGETGVGKELVARAIHTASGRTGEFVDLNGALLPDDTMLMSELFGHEKGSFTDAKAMRRGKLETADGGTLFLDEVGELSRDVQAKLLRVLETMSFNRLGGSQIINVDVRIIVATNRDLREEAEAGRFRSDLYYRLNVFPIQIPPLRKRRDDIPALAKYFLERTAKRYARPEPELTAGAMELLSAYNWPGNIRELRNICERLVIRARGGTRLTADDVHECGIGPAAETARVIDFPDEGIDLDDLEQQLVLEALRRAEWVQTEAARLLGISVDRMNSRVKKFGFTHPKWRVNKVTSNT